MTVPPRTGPAPLLGIVFGLLLSLTAWWAAAGATAANRRVQSEHEARGPRADPHLQRMLDRRDSDAPAPLPAGGLPTFEATTDSPGDDGPLVPAGGIAFLVILLATVATASALNGRGRLTFLLLSGVCALPGVVLGVVTLWLGTLTKGPA